MFTIGFCYPIEWGADELEANLRRLKALGYDGVEFWEQSLRGMEIARVAEALAAAEIGCAQLCPYFNFVDGLALWDASIRLAEEYLGWAEQVGCRLIRVFTGKPWGEGVVGPYDATPAQWEAAIAGLQHICDLGAARGVRYALECHTGSLMEDSPSALRLLAGVNRPNLGTNLQLPLASGHEPIEVSLQALGRYTVHMHAHNYTALLDGRQLPLGEGVLDYPDILTRLICDGFHGCVSIEHANYGGTRDPWAVAAHEAVYLRALRERLAG
jgi:sugar phosphate isomerase/epimerase